MNTSEEVVRELLRALNELGEHDRVEAKTASDMGRSILETVCAFANEPGLGGGDILLGVARGATGDLFEPGGYEIVGVPDPEKLAADVATQCASSFNRPLRPRITTLALEGFAVLHVQVAEMSPGEKPVFFKARGLPSGAFRRVGATDQRCTEDDIQILYDARRRSPYDAEVAGDASWRDIDFDVVHEYRELRKEIAPDAEELRYADDELLLALGAVRAVGAALQPTVAGLLLFGTSAALRRLFAMQRIDYIRVPGREWVPDPDDRYATVEIRAPLIRAVRRAEAAIVDDLPKAFHLPEGSLHRQDVLPLPRKVLREALVNAVMHRDYRVHGATQVIRYANRIEIRNPGYSLKAPDRLGEPGSEARNPTIAAVLHDTNLAETKGTGIRVMRRLMREAELVPPTFDSDREANFFTARLLLHHFLASDDLVWLEELGTPGLSADEKLVLVFVREVGAVDNATYRDLTGAETLKASAGLRHLCELGLLEKRGQSTATYYVSAGPLTASEATKAAPVSAFVEREPAAVRSKPGVSGIRPRMAGADPPLNESQPAMAAGKPAMAPAKSAMAHGTPSQVRLESAEALRASLPTELRDRLGAVGRHAEKPAMRALLRRLCSHGPYSAEQLALLLDRNARYLKERYLRDMLRTGELRHTIPDMPKHPDQKYRAVEGGE